VLSSFPSSPYVSQAEFGLGRIAEQQGKLSEAAGYYGKVTATGAGGTLAQEAALRASEVKLKMAAAAPKAAATQVESAIKSALAPKPAATTPAATTPPAAKP
jgi:TolA-binding protein